MRNSDTNSDAHTHGSGLSDTYLHAGRYARAMEHCFAISDH
jgi:hypothetical protein